MRSSAILLALVGLAAATDYSYKDDHDDGNNNGHDDSHDNGNNGHNDNHNNGNGGGGKGDGHKGAKTVTETVTEHKVSF